ncbi:MAG: outer membrane beta-barrel protein [Halobacteriovoraceae bacterium]|nr:outer membrane beta-barrel protein [Halobacteriovoraceae bacterium]
MRKYFLKTFLIIFASCFFQVQAAFMFNVSTFYFTDSDNAGTTNFSYTRMNNNIFLGASMGKKEQFFFGVSYMMITRSNSNGSDTDEVSTTEIGPTFLYYFNKDRNWYVSGGWLPFAKGDRTLTGVSEDIDGSGLHGAFGYQVKFSKHFYLGASINYHSTSITESIDSANTKSDVSNSYSTIMPMFDLSIRFK